MISIDLKDKVALVTGCDNCEGRKIAEVFAAAGAIVVVNYLNEKDSAESLVNDITSQGGKAMAIKTDVSEYEQVALMAEQVIETLGKIDILVNDAELTSVQTITKLGLEQWNKVLKYNLYGVFNTSKAVSKHMVKRGSGVIVNITSAIHFTGLGGGIDYSASKAAIHGFTLALARELAPKGIRVNAIAPTKELIEKYDDVGYMAAFLASPLAEIVCGEIFTIDGSLTCQKKR